MEKAPHKKEKLTEVIAHTAAEWIEKESGPQSMITVTHVEVSSDFHKSTIFVTVFPDEKEKDALLFLERNLSEFRDVVKEKTRIARVPWFSFRLDDGEKSRQRIDEISRSL
jgi:ribosome-binding factor A